MKESEFIELLNLYVDHEISAADAARLEAEVTGDSARRRTYRQYCSMDKACGLLAAKFGETATKAAPVERRAPQRSWVGGFYATGMLAAACVAVLLVVRTRSGSPANPAAVAVSQPAAAPARALAVSDRPLQSVLTVHDLSLDAESPAVDAMLRVNGQNDPLAWISHTPQMSSVTLPPMMPAHFPASQGILESNPSVVPASATQPPAAEMAAFRYFER